MIQNETLRIVVIGAAGQGKSSLINLLMDNKDDEKNAKVGDDLDGVTKEITEFQAQIGQSNIQLVLYDLPGFGDIEVSVDILTQQWNTKLANKKIDLIFFCHQISNSRMDMITRIGLALMTRCLKNPMLEKSFVIVVTQVDLKPEKEVDEFNSNFIQKQLVPKLKQLVDASELNKIIYSSNKQKERTIHEVEKICREYLEEKKILRVGLLGESKSGKTAFINQFLLNKIEYQEQLQMIEGHKTNHKINELQIEFVEIQFRKEISKDDFSKEWVKLYGSKRLNLLFLFINQGDEIMDILQEVHIQKYQDILEQKQLIQSYYIFINPQIQVNFKQYLILIQKHLKKNKIQILLENKFIFKLSENDNIKSNFDQCIDLYEKAMKEFKNTEAKKMTDSDIKDSKQQAQKSTGKDCLSLSGRILTDKGYICISELSEGQTILVSQNGQIKTDKIIAFIHKNQRDSTKFIKIIFQNQEFITLTPNHLLKLYGCTFIKAKSVKIGDLIERDDGYVSSPGQVLQIQHVYEEGFTCPLSISGQLIINGYVVSCYSNCSQRLGDIFTWPIRNIQILRNLFKQGPDSEQIHPYFRFLLSINKRLKLVNEEL
ncbi:intein-mediated protein splicing [Paramecium bursaria]